MPRVLWDFYHVSKEPSNGESTRGHRRISSSRAIFNTLEFAGTVSRPTIALAMLKQCYFQFLSSLLPNDERLDRASYDQFVKFCIYSHVTLNSANNTEKYPIGSGRASVVSLHEIIGAHAFNVAKNIMAIHWELQVLYNAFIISPLRLKLKVKLPYREIRHREGCCCCCCYGVGDALGKFLLFIVELPRISLFIYSYLLYFPMAVIGDFITHPVYMMSRRNPWLGYGLIIAAHLAVPGVDSLLAWLNVDFALMDGYYTIVNSIASGQGISLPILGTVVQMMTTWLGHYFAICTFNSVLLLGVGLLLPAGYSLGCGENFFDGLYQTYKNFFVSKTWIELVSSGNTSLDVVKVEHFADTSHWNGRFTKRVSEDPRGPVMMPPDEELGLEDSNRGEGVGSGGDSRLFTTPVTHKVREKSYPRSEPRGEESEFTLRVRRAVSQSFSTPGHTAEETGGRVSQFTAAFRSSSGG